MQRQFRANEKMINMIHTVGADAVLMLYQLLLHAGINNNINRLYKTICYKMKNNVK